MTGTDMVHVPYRGNAPALADLLAGQVQLGFDTMPAAIEYIRAGRLRALGVSTTARSHTLPDLPAVSEFVPGYESSAYFGFGAPVKTPIEIVDRLNKRSTRASPIRSCGQLAELGSVIIAGSPDDFRTLIAKETESGPK
jgi:tripartite-type tricarboxylate transporter receptor subunit TctC